MANKNYLFLLGACLLLTTACKKYAQTNSLSGTFYGPVVQLANGTVKSFVVLDNYGKMLTLGMHISAAALVNLPADSTKMWVYPIDLPAQAQNAGYDHIELDWNPIGHDPKPIYGLPHFDCHFYKVTKEYQAGITAGTDTMTIPARYLAPDYVSNKMIVPGMGVHYADSKAPEFTGQKFTATYIYGFYKANLIFLEPMVTAAFLLSNPDYKIQIKQPASFQSADYYPTITHIYYDAMTKEYVIALEGMALKISDHPTL